MVGVKAAYELHIDLDGDRDFTDPGEDFSGDWKVMEWRLGMTGSFDGLAREATLSLTLHNADGRFSPEHGSALSGFTPGALVRVRSTYNLTTHQHFIGWIEPGGIKPLPGTKGRRETQVTVNGYFGRLQEAEVKIALQENQPTDALVAALVDAAKVYPPGMTGWLLGMTGFSELETGTRLSAGLSDYTDLDEGQTLVAYAGDNWGEEVSLYQAMKDIVSAEGEGALLYVDRAGKLVFRSRHWLYQDLPTALDASFDQYDILENGLYYAYGTRLVNDLTLTLHPRKVGESVEVLGTLDKALLVRVGEEQTTFVRFDDGSGNKIGGKDLVTPLPNTDYMAKSAESSGDDLTSNISVSMEESATGARLTFHNGGSRHAYIQAGSKVRGVKVTDFGEQEAAYEDETSILAFGRQRERRNLRLLDDTRYAEDLARWTVLTRKDPNGEIEAMTVLANVHDSLMDSALALTIGDRVSVSEGQTGASGEYLIVGERHQVASHHEHRVTWTLRPVPSQGFWLLGQASFGELDSGAVLGL